VIKCIVNCRPGYIEYLLFELRQKIESYLDKKGTEFETNTTKRVSQTQRIEEAATDHEPIYDSRRSSMHNISPVQRYGASCRIIEVT
jgi:predicted metal-dependent RNase